MTVKLLIAFLMLSFCGKAQIESNENVYSLYRIPNPPTMVDTVKCIMLVSDTSHSYYTYFKIDSIPNGNTLYVKGHEVKEDNGFSNTLLYWTKGHEVRICEFICCDPSEHVLAKSYWSCGHSEYLDENKKPLSKNIIVWMSKNTEP